MPWFYILIKIKHNEWNYLKFFNVNAIHGNKNNWERLCGGTGAQIRASSLVKAEFLNCFAIPEGLGISFYLKIGTFDVMWLKLIDICLPINECFSNNENRASREVNNSSFSISFSYIYIPKALLSCHADLAPIILINVLSEWTFEVLVLRTFNELLDKWPPPPPLN